MAAITISKLISQSLHHHRLISSSQPLLRLFSSNSNSDSESPPSPSLPNPFNPQSLSQSLPSEPFPAIRPVSYPVKPQPDPDQTPPEPRPVRVAPLPEYTPPVDAAGENAAEESPVLRRQRVRFQWRKTDEQTEEEKASEASPFPSLLKPLKKETRPVLDLMEAIRQVKAGAKCSFDETVEAHVKLGIDAKRAGKGVRGSMSLPHGSGKVVRVAFFAEGKHAEEAIAAGVDVVGGAELIEEIASTKKLNFDKCFATNEMILRMGKISRILRERGLWPDRKLGTVTNDVLGAVNKVRQGHVEFKMDKTAIVHAGIGKVSYSEDYIRENIGAFVNALLLAKPAGLKKTSKYAGYINSFHICSTMGPGFPVSIQSISKAADHYNKLQLK